MTNLDKETSEIAKEKRKQRAKERLNSLSGGDITRGLNSGVKERGLVSDTYSTQQAKAKVGAKAQAQKAKSTSTTAKKTTSSSKSSSKSDEKAKGIASSKEKVSPIENLILEVKHPIKSSVSDRYKRYGGKILPSTEGVSLNKFSEKNCIGI